MQHADVPTQDLHASTPSIRNFCSMTWAKSLKGFLVRLWLIEDEGYEWGFSAGVNGGWCYWRWAGSSTLIGRWFLWSSWVRFERKQQTRSRVVFGFCEEKDGFLLTNSFCAFLHCLHLSWPKEFAKLEEDTTKRSHFLDVCNWINLGHHGNGQLHEISLLLIPELVGMAIRKAPVNSYERQDSHLALSILTL